MSPVVPAKKIASLGTRRMSVIVPSQPPLSGLFRVHCCPFLMAMKLLYFKRFCRERNYCMTPVTLKLAIFKGHFANTSSYNVTKLKVKELCSLWMDSGVFFPSSPTSLWSPFLPRCAHCSLLPANVAAVSLVRIMALPSGFMGQTVRHDLTASS